MAARSDLRAMLPAALGLAALLVGVAVVQERWIGRWSEVEDLRLRTAIVDGAREVDEALSEQIAQTALPFVEIDTPRSGLADSLSVGLDGSKALPIRHVYWVTPGPSPTLQRLDLDRDQLVEASWDEAGAPWREYFTREPLLLREGVPLRLDNTGAPASPQALVIPTLPRPGEPAPFVLLALDVPALTSTVFAPLLDQHLGLGNAFSVSIGPPDGPSLYTTSPVPTEASVPDLVRPVGARLISALRVNLINDGGEQRLEVDQGELGAGQGQWELRVQHRAGSIGAAVGRLRWQQRGLALVLLLVLAGTVALLLRSTLAQRSLARQQLAFVAGVSHELRTPLAVLGSAGENLADGITADPEAVRAYGTLIRDESRRLAETVESVLALGGIDARTASREEESMEEIVREAHEISQTALIETGTTLTLDLAEGLPPVRADRRALVAAVRNLIVNAARHGGTTARLTVAAQNGSLQISVFDDGTGPPPGLDVFEPFARGVAAAKGSGLGLPLVRRVAEHHGGTASLEREVGQTRATLTLPL